MIVPLLAGAAKTVVVSMLSLVRILHGELIPKWTWKFFPHHRAQVQKMKVPPVDNSGSTPTGKNALSQADTVKKAEFDTVMREVMANLDELKSMGATPPDTVKKADLDQVMEEVYNGLRELHYRVTDLEVYRRY